MVGLNNRSQLELKCQPFVPIFILVCSIFNLGASLIVGSTISTITGIVMLTASILMLTRTVAVITPSEIRLMNLLGMTLKTHPYTPAQVSIRNNSVYVDNKKVLSSWWTNASIAKIRAFLERDAMNSF